MCEINGNIIKLILPCGKFNIDNISDKLKKKLKKYRNVTFDIVSGEENDCRKTIGFINHIQINKISLNKIKLKTCYGTFIYDSNNIINEAGDFIEIIMKNITQEQAESINNFVVVLIFNKLK